MRKGFTLIELIFVIVIIGLLAAVAVPKFVNLKQNAEAANVVKATVDAAQQAVEAAVNQIDLEGKDVNLSDLIQLKGKNWHLDDTTLHNNRYYYKTTSGIVSEINFSVSPREVNYSINCANFDDAETQKKCKNLLGLTDKNSTGTIELKF